MLSTVVIFGLSISEIAMIALGAGYVTSLARDWRPMKSLRQENRDLRDDLNKANLEIADLKTEVASLRHATDLTALHEGQSATVQMLRALVDEVKALDTSVHRNTEAITSASVAATAAATAAAEILSKQKLIDDRKD